MQFIASFENGTTTHVVAVDEDGFTHLEDRWTDADGVLQGREMVYGSGALCDLIAALKSAQKIAG